MSFLLPSFRRQQRVLDFVSLEQRCPEGVYITLNPDHPAQWAGVLFVRQGPFESALLRFDITFPPLYPDSAPSVVFSTDVFHPLVVPLTQYTFGAGALDPSSTCTASEEDRLPPGAFCLRHGFPHWFRKGTSNRDSFDVQEEIEPQHLESYLGHNEPGTTYTDDPRQATLRLLEHLKQAFGDEELLDRVQLPVAGNPSAWHAWRAFRGLSTAQARGRSSSRDDPPDKSPSSPKQMSDWNWDGVWESRVRRSVEDSVSEAGLYTNQGLIKFAKTDADHLREIRQKYNRD